MKFNTDDVYDYDLVRTWYDVSTYDVSTCDVSTCDVSMYVPFFPQI